MNSNTNYLADLLKSLSQATRLKIIGFSNAIVRREVEMRSELIKIKGRN